MVTKLDSKCPSGPIEDRWTTCVEAWHGTGEGGTIIDHHGNTVAVFEDDAAAYGLIRALVDMQALLSDNRKLRDWTNRLQARRRR